MGSVPVNVVVSQLMMYSDVIVSITISRGSFVFSQFHVTVSTSLTNEHLHLSVVEFVPVLNRPMTDYGTG